MAAAISALSGARLIFLQPARIGLHHLAVLQKQQPQLLSRRAADERFSFVKRCAQ
jgi:hypothetical protein